MKIDYKTNFKGYFVLHRSFQYLLKSKKINFNQLGALICFVSQADFDKRHKNYGVLLRDDNELATEWSCDSSTIYRNRKILIKKGLLIERDGFTVIPNFILFELEWVKILANLPSSILQNVFVNPKEGIANMQEIIAEMQSARGQKKP